MMRQQWLKGNLAHVCLLKTFIPECTVSKSFGALCVMILSCTDENTYVDSKTYGCTNERTK
jgi:hypothetical protein